MVGKILAEPQKDMGGILVKVERLYYFGVFCCIRFVSILVRHSLRVRSDCKVVRNVIFAAVGLNVFGHTEWSVLFSAINSVNVHRF